MISIHDDVAMEQFRRQAKWEPHVLRRLRSRFCKKGESAQAVLDGLPMSQQELARAEIKFHSLVLHNRQDSRIDGASKLLFCTSSGLMLETIILRIASGRTSVCISSQVGCAAGCTFCATGQMGTAKNLAYDEILDQVIQASHQLRGEGRSVRNVVFMGMGEPLHNEAAVHRALRVLQSPQFMNLSPGKILVSTVGIPDAMIRFAEQFPQVGLALSLHSARQEVRAQLIPLANRHPLDPLRTTLIRVTRLLRRLLMIEYVMLKGRNDSEDDLHALIDYLRGLPVHINLIPWNPIDDASELKSTGSSDIHRFAAALREAGFVVTVRYSLGSDIEAACGQLVRRNRYNAERSSRSNDSMSASEL
jgi:23S rRNA (adenine2503-C2)-methyltransferase